jgi:hypothetical protein
LVPPYQAEKQILKWIFHPFPILTKSGLGECALCWALQLGGCGSRVLVFPFLWFVSTM